MEYKTSNKYYRLWVFWVGIIATVAYRIIVVLNYYSALWVEISWYIGTIGFIWYFAHRYRVENYYSKIVNERNLREKLDKNELDAEDHKALSYILKGVGSSKARLNYIAIFVLSILALIYGVVVDVIKILD